MHQSIYDRQPVVTRILGNSFSAKRLSHAYLFEGQKGTGKLEMAMQLTKLFFCKKPNSFEPCENCTTCKRINSGNFPDVHIVRPDGQSIKKERVQNLQHEISLMGVESQKKVYIIEHIDRMTVSAANSLLKFLEEPNSGIMAILITERIHSLLDTIISRCQTLNFTSTSSAGFVGQLKEVGVDERDAKILAALTGNLEDARSIAEDESFGKSISFIGNLMGQWFERSPISFITIQSEWSEAFPGKEEQYLALELITIWLKDIFYLMSEKEDIVFEKFGDVIKRQAESVSIQTLANCMGFVIEGKKRLKGNVNSQLVIEALTSNVLREVS